MAAWLSWIAEQRLAAGFLGSVADKRVQMSPKPVPVVQ
jgi:hypothetical protein